MVFPSICFVLNNKHFYIVLSHSLQFKLDMFVYMYPLSMSDNIVIMALMVPVLSCAYVLV
jgi:hypothetical protein